VEERVYFEGVVGEAMVFFSWLVEHGGGGGGLGSVLVSLDGMRWFVVLDMWYFNCDYIYFGCPDIDLGRSDSNSGEPSL
jgi:hypothetical protein